MLHDVVVVWPGSCNNVATEHEHWFDFQLATRFNRVAKRVQHVAPNNVGICCVEMLLSFSRGFIYFVCARARPSSQLRALMTQLNHAQKT